MTREEEIHNFIKDSGICDYKYDDLLDYNEYVGGDVICAFIEGVKWADEHPKNNDHSKNVWHPASEEPDNLTQIVCVCDMFGSKQVYSFRVDMGNPIEWKHIVKFRHLEKWAYFNELIED